jgi:hypothetical protein
MDLTAETLRNAEETQRVTKKTQRNGEEAQRRLKSDLTLDYSLRQTASRESGSL